MSTPVSSSGSRAASPSLEEVANLQAPQAPPSAPAGNRAASTQQGNSLSQAPKPSPGADSPREVPTGTLNYYRQRAADFTARNPGTPPPPYYLDYGDKYVHAFSALTSEQLSPEGMKWRDKALTLLQQSIEKRRAEDPSGFARLERDPEAFKRFAYQTHVEAYLGAGLLKLPAQDLTTIMTTPELKDLLNAEGVEQIGRVLQQVRPEDMGNIGTATAKESLRKDVQLPLEQMEREVKSFMQQRWMLQDRAR